ncbi:MAG: hypothetical protein ACRC1H_14475 [Caldilineaceae bacterium]
MSTSKSKPKSQPSKGNPSNYSQMYKNAAAGAPTVAPVSASGGKAVETDAATQRVRTSDDVDWGHEYAYVKGDLTRLGLVTAGLVVTIIVVGLFI